MEDFIVSARKYRPQTFDSVVGQENITNTLLKSIAQNHLAQAFLFCGPRGVGKTTCARILARTVNKASGSETAPHEDFAFNIFELDAASNNSVDDIRSLIDQVRIPPQVGKYKVYIIDEVHMLSTNAFNAFLKTLEEPPAYAIFILATTEKHKVLPTILSRCQVFDFNRIQISDMVSHLQGIAVKEGVEAEHDALHIIAEKADGALRDALSIFDQMVSFSGNKVTYADVITNLNVLDYDYYFGLTDAFLAGDRTTALVTFDSIIKKGFDAHNFVNGLADHFRNLLFCVDEATTAILEVGDNIKEKYLAQSAACDVRFILNGLNTLSETDSHYKSSRNQRLLVELALLKLCKIGGGLPEKKNTEQPDVSTEPAAKPKESATPADVKASLLAKAEKLQELQGGAHPQPTQASAPQPADPAITPRRETDQQAPVTEGIEEADAPSPQPSPQPEVKMEAPSALPPVERVREPDEVNPQQNRAAMPSQNPDNSNGAARNFSSRLAGRRSKSMPSLHDTGTDLNKKGDEGNGGEAENLNPLALNEDRPATPFNLAQLWEVWDAYAAQIKEQDRQSYYSTLTKRKPVVREENKVELIIDNHVQLSDLEADKTNLLVYLREELKNWHIQLEGVIEDADTDDDVHLYTPEERFKAMLESNPTLASFKQRFDLDVEHDS